MELILSFPSDREKADQFDLNSLLGAYAADEALDGWTCPKCGKKNAKMHRYISKFPDVLQISVSLSSF